MKQKIFIIATMCLSLATQLKAQSITGTILQQPCNNDGKLAVNVTGMALPITYHYRTAGQSVTYPNVSSTSFTFTGISAELSYGFTGEVYVSASSGNTWAYQTFYMTMPFTYSVSAVQAVCPALGTVNITPATGGTAPYTYNLVNSSSMQAYTTNPAYVTPGGYKLHVTDGAGCVVNLDSAVYLSPNSSFSVSATTTPANCTNGTAAVSVVGSAASPYSYLWNNGANTASISGLSAGYYTCIIMDAQGCQSTGYSYVSQTPTISLNTTVTNATCIQNDGSIMGFPGGGTAPYTVAWSTGATTQNISGLAGNQYYTAVVTDANGCTGNSGTYVSSSTPITVTYMTSPSSCTSATGAATLTLVGGQAPYSVSWNTSPVATGTTIANMPVGDYGFKVTDANGCIQTGVVHIPPVSILVASINGGTVTCPATQSNLQVNIISGSNPPFTYAWSTGATTQGINNAPLGNYTCVIQDAVGCSVTKNVFVQQVSPVNLGLSSAQASCLYAADGTALATATGGTSPYTYHWSNGFTGANPSGLSSAYYYVTATDANGCSNEYPVNNSVYVGYNAANTSCYCTISGTVYNDANNNCTMDAGETPIPNIMMHCSGVGFVFSDANGQYSFMAPTGTYTLSESVQTNYPLASCQSNSVSVSVTAASGCITTIDFANNLVPVHDLHIITCNMNAPIPGNTYLQKVIVQNEGTIAESNIQLGYEHDGQMVFGSSSLVPFVQQNAVTAPDWYSVTSGFPSLTPGGSVATIIDYAVPGNIPLNTTVNFFDTVAYAAPIATNWLTDNTPWNNVNQKQAVVIGSYDPNFKEVSPKGSGAPGYITTADSVLNYVIHFQNTGSYFAQNVVLVDSLDADLNIRTLRPGYADHDYTTTVSETGVVKFTFNNIHLPWKQQYGDALSSGMVTYSVRMNPHLAPGTQIKNKAAIYFDYNEPVITNTTLNTLATPVSVNEIKAMSKDDVQLYPNPASDAYTLVMSSDQKASYVLSIMDLEGRTLVQKTLVMQAGTNVISEDTRGLESGIYFVQLKSETNLVTKKLMVTK